ncbi:MAG: DUF3313 family protein [Woeseiaceae bacterium]
MKMKSLLTMAAIGLMAVALPAVAKDKLPEVSSDGLNLVPKTKVYAAYTKPGATFDQFTKVKILDCYVEFVKNWQKDYNLNEVGLSGRVSDKDAEKIKQRLAEEFNNVFVKELNKKGHEVVEEVGPDVLLLRPALINVDVAAPDTMSASMSRTFVRSAGSMTLYLELYDSSTSTLLARVIDPQGDRGGFAQAANRMTNRVAADRILREWADLLATHL